MSDPSHDSGSSKNSPMNSSIPGRKARTKSLVTTTASSFRKNAYGHITSLHHSGRGSSLIVHGASFLVKVAALETLRRFSKAKCPFVWRCLQALQLLCCPPFKWIQKWAFFRNLVKGMQTLSRPLLFLSIATVFTEPEETNNESSNHIDNPQPYSDHPPESAAPQSTFDSSCLICNEASQVVTSESWIACLKKELENQGIRLPNRINEDELRRFRAAANGDFSCLLSSIKRTIRWRDTYRILNAEELESWSQMVFWHGHDVNQRPCLIVRLGLACFSLPSHARPRFAQAVISQVEHGVLHLEEGNSQITVLVDCEGLTPFKIPMQTMRSCFFLLQDHYPNRLGCSFVIRLSPVVRVIAQTLIQVLKPKTREKLRIEGEMYEKVLAEYLQTLPSYLGGKCACLRCRNIESSDERSSQSSQAGSTEPTLALVEAEGEAELVFTRSRYEMDVDPNVDCNQVLRTAMVAILMLWLLAALIAGVLDPESRPAFLLLTEG